MTKKQSLQKKATELGVEFDEKATIAELEALINNQEARTFDNPEQYVQEEKEEATVDAAKAGATKADVVDARGGIIRTYTRERHGDDFEQLAQSFVSNPKRSMYTIQVE